MDGRRRENLRRAQIALSFHQALLYSLFDKLLQGEDEDLKLLIRKRRTLDDLDELAAYLHVQAPQSPEAFEAVVQARLAEVEDRGGQDSDDTLPTSHRTLSTDSRNPFPGVALSQHPSKSSLELSASGRRLLPRHHERQILISTTSAHKLLPLNTSIHCHAISSLLTQFLNSCHHALDEGASWEAVLGPQKVDLDYALFGSQLDGRCFLTPSTWMCEMQQKFESLDVYVRLIWTYMISQYLRWIISPTPENFSLLPECMVPTACQRQIHHHAAIDICHLPALRDLLIQRDGAERPYDDEYIVALQVAGIRTAWSGTWSEAVIFDEQLQYHTLTPQFIAVASKVDNWTAGRALLRTFPGLLDCMQFAEEETISIDDRQLYEVLRTNM